MLKTLSLWSLSLSQPDWFRRGPLSCKRNYQNKSNCLYWTFENKSSSFRANYCWNWKRTKEKIQTMIKDNEVLNSCWKTQISILGVNFLNEWVIYHLKQLSFINVESIYRIRILITWLKCFTCGSIAGSYFTFWSSEVYWSFGWLISL